MIQLQQTYTLLHCGIHGIVYVTSDTVKPSDIVYTHLNVYLEHCCRIRSGIQTPKIGLGP